MILKKPISILLFATTFSISANENNNLDNFQKTDIQTNNSNSFTLDTSDFNNFEFYQVEKDTIRHEDNEKTIEIFYGETGIAKYINDLEEKLLNVDSKDGESLKSNMVTSQIVHEIQLYKSELDKIASGSSKIQSVTKVFGEPVFGGNCSPSMSQTYTFSPGFWRFNLSVQSSYARQLLPGPLPPSRPVTLHASADMSVNFNGYMYYPSSSTTFTGNNYGDGLAYAFTTTGFIGGGDGQVSINWKATSIMSMPHCFEYVVVTGNTVY